MFLTNLTPSLPLQNEITLRYIHCFSKYPTLRLHRITATYCGVVIGFAGAYLLLSKPIGFCLSTPTIHIHMVSHPGATNSWWALLRSVDEQTESRPNQLSHLSRPIFCGGFGRTCLPVFLCMLFDS